MTPKQEQFAQAVAVEGLNYSEAYRACYKTEKMTDKSIWDAASKLASHSEVSQRILELREAVLTPKIMSAQKRREKLTKLAESVDANIAMKAIDLLNKMDGEYVQKVQADVQTETTINIELVDDDEC
jgi:phage terminase small subunit